MQIEGGIYFSEIFVERQFLLARFKMMLPVNKRMDFMLEFGFQFAVP